jgi:Divergent InlB B-repeat domain
MKRIGWRGAARAILLSGVVSLGLASLIASAPGDDDPQQPPFDPPIGPVAQTLTVMIAGDGSVASAPAGIACGGDCSESYDAGTSVTLTATAAGTSLFDRWSGDCAGTAPSTMVTMNTFKTCTATFRAPGSGAWQTLAGNIASSQVTDLASSVVLDANGQAYIGYLQRVGMQSRISVRREANGSFIPLGGALNANQSWSATSVDLLLDASGNPLMAFNVDLDANVVVQWTGVQWQTLSSRLNLTANAGSRPRIVRAGNTLVAAWIDGARIAVRRYALDTQQWDAGAFTPDPDGAAINSPLDIDLAVDSNGLAVLAYSVGATGGTLRALRETSPGVWSALGGDIGVRPPTGPTVLALGVHVDSSDVVRLVWAEGSTNYFLSGAEFDGTNWIALPGQAQPQLLQSARPLRALGVNRSSPLFAFAYAIDTAGSSPPESDVFVRQLASGALTDVGGSPSVVQPRVGALSIAINTTDEATLVQSQSTPADVAEPYKLAVRRYVP